MGLNVKGLQQALDKAREKQKYARLVDFVRAAWPIVEGTNEYKHNWHIDLICEHLEAVEKGDIKNLLLNIPPGSSKSTIASVCFPAWVWSKNPEARILTASYAQELATRDAVKSRHILESAWYQALWPNSRIQTGDATKTKFSLTKGGWRLATSVGGRGTGEHPLHKIIDDPHNAKEAESDVERQAALDWFDTTLSTRGASRNARTIVVMQRLHEKDLSGHIMDKLDFRDEWTHICLPMRYEPDRMLMTKLGARDPRTKDGELLWPELFTEKIVATLEGNLGEYAAASQLQQRPAPIGGGLIKTSHFKLWPIKEPLPDFSFILQSYDCAFTENTINDPTACVVFGIFEKDKRKQVLILDAWEEHLAYPELRKRVVDDWQAKYGGQKRNKMDDPLHPPRRVDLVVVENKGSGISLLQDLRNANVGARAWNPGKADKVSRAIQATPLLEQDLCWVMESSREPGKPITWIRSFIKQLSLFPVADHDDFVDCFSQAFLYFRDSNLLSLPKAPLDYAEDIDYKRNRTSMDNPYLV